ncbi:hypothetical protein ACFQFQ_24460 [Sulfitobacter porphyrae]|uniref:SPW repeat-containing protein n=1 Tax=Sulfitobacter porphyrae TaxID=1246864 RepID=A0ABW2B873_9RHOB|nr:hypothetical protein GCM10007928_37550 [Sulfitobacter porphyrae]
MLHQSQIPALQTILKLDSATCALMGALLVSASGLVAGVTAIPADLLFWAGLLLLPVAAFMAVLAGTVSVPSLGTCLVIGGNVLWIVASLALPVTGVISPNAFGWILVLGQAVVVAGFVWAEWTAAQR